MSLVLQGEAVRPADQPAQQRVPSGRKIRASYPFTVVHHHTWSFCEDQQAGEAGEWRPEVSEIRHVPGGNGVFIQDDRIVAEPAMTGAYRKGSIVIRQDDRRLGDFRYYLSRYLLDSGAYFYCYKWVKVVLINRGRNAVPRPDAAALCAFQRRLLEADIVDPMPEEALNEHILLHENRLSRWDTLRAEGRLTQEAYAEQIAQTRSHIERMKAAWARQFGDVETFGALAEPGTMPADPDSLAVDGVPEMEIEISTETTPKRTRGRK